MGDGRSSEGFSNSDRIDRGYQSVSPELGQEVYERTQSTGQPGSDWRGGYGTVAPAFGNPPNTADRGGVGDPSGSTNGNGYRGGYGDVAPSFGDNRPANPGTNPGGNPGDNPGGTRTPNGEVVPAWPPRPVPNTPNRGGINGDGTPRGTGNAQPGSGTQGQSALRQELTRTKPLIDRSLQPFTSYWGNEIVGGFAGGLLGPGGPVSSGLSRGAKSYLAKSDGMSEWAKAIRENGPPTEGAFAKAKYNAAGVAEKPISWGQKGAQWWDKNFGTRTDQQLADLRSLKRQDVQLTTKADAIAESLKPEADRITAKLASKGTEVAVTAEEQALLQRYNYLKGTGQVPPAGMLAAEEAALLEQRGMVRAQVKTLESELTKHPTGGRAFVQNFARGMLVVAGTQMINDRMDRGLTGKSHNSAGQVIDSIVVPAAMLLPGGFGLKGIVTKGLAIVGGHYVGQKLFGDAIQQSESPGWNRFWRPTGTEAFLTAGAALIPLRATSWWARPAMIATAMFGTKALNYAFGDKTGEEKRDEAVEAFVKDKSQRSGDSMISAIDEFKELGKTHEPALKWYLADWLDKKHEGTGRLNGHRGLVMLFTAAGETRLDHGTEVSQGNGQPTSSLLSRVNPWHDTNKFENNFILAGYDIDLGGRALRDLVSAKIELGRAKEYTKILAERGETVKDTKVQASEAAELDRVEQRIDASIGRIYGRHDIPKIMKEFQEWTYTLNQKDADKMIRQKAKTTILNPGTADPQYIAKQYRDLALIDLAWAGNKVGYNGVGKGADGASAAIMYSEAVAALRQAKALDPNNPDLAQLETIAQDLGKIVPHKEDAQWSNPNYNPLNVDDKLKK